MGNTRNVPVTYPIMYVYTCVYVLRYSIIRILVNFTQYTTLHNAKYIN